jgi:hypothetical protein
MNLKCFGIAIVSYAFAVAAEAESPDAFLPIEANIELLLKLEQLDDSDWKILARVGVSIVDIVENSNNIDSAIKFLKELDHRILQMKLPNWIMYSDEYRIAITNGDGQRDNRVRPVENCSFGTDRAPSLFTMERRNVGSLISAGIHRLEMRKKRR